MISKNRQIFIFTSRITIPIYFVWLKNQRHFPTFVRDLLIFHLGDPLGDALKKLSLFQSVFLLLSARLVGVLTSTYTYVNVKCWYINEKSLKMELICGVDDATGTKLSKTSVFWIYLKKAQTSKIFFLWTSFKKSSKKNFSWKLVTQRGSKIPTLLHNNPPLMSKTSLEPNLQ